MQNPKAELFKQLTISVEKLPASMAQQSNLTSYAAERARLLLGCYRTGEANDPDTYVAAITAVLAHYPEEVITRVTHPAVGLPSKKSWLPTVKEVRDACDDIAEPIARRQLEEVQIIEQLAAREAAPDRSQRPSVEELKAKYGENWGMKSLDEKPKSTFKVPTFDELQRYYAEHPERIMRLLNSDLAIRDDTHDQNT